MALRVAGGVNGKAVGWGASLLLLAAVLAFVPGSLAIATGPRVAFITFLIVFGLILALSAIVGPWMLRRSAKAQGLAACPVGTRCAACSNWIWKPRRTCAACGAATIYAAAADRDAAKSGT